MIFKKATPTPTNILRMLANCYVDVLKINMLSSVFPSVAVPWPMGIYRKAMGGRGAGVGAAGIGLGY